MTCQPGAIKLGMSEEAKALKCTGVGDYYCMRLRRQIPCPKCGVELNAGSMTAHHCCMHGTEPVIDCNRLPVSKTEHHLQVYDISFPWTTKRCRCPLPGCLVSYSTWNGLRLHFISQHWGESIMTLEEHQNHLSK